VSISSRTEQDNMKTEKTANGKKKGKIPGQKGGAANSCKEESAGS